MLYVYRYISYNILPKTASEICRQIRSVIVLVLTLCPTLSIILITHLELIQHGVWTICLQSQTPDLQLSGLIRMWKKTTNKHDNNEKTLVIESLHFRLADDLAVCLHGFLVAQVGALLHGHCGMLVFVVLHDGVGDGGQQQDGQQDVEFILQAYEGAVGEGDDETKWLPHAVVGERRLFVPGEEDAIKSCRKVSTIQHLYHIWLCDDLNKKFKGA